MPRRRSRREHHRRSLTNLPAIRQSGAVPLRRNRPRTRRRKAHRHRRRRTQWPAFNIANSPMRPQLQRPRALVHRNRRIQRSPLSVPSLADIHATRRTPSARPRCPRVHFRARIQQQIQNLIPLPFPSWTIGKMMIRIRAPCRPIQRCCAAQIARIHLHTPIQQQLHHACPAKYRRLVKSRSPKIPSNINVRSPIQQQLHHVRMSRSRRLQQRRPARRTVINALRQLPTALPVDVRPVVQQQPGQLQPPLHRRNHQRSSFHHIGGPAGNGRILRFNIGAPPQIFANIYEIVPPRRRKQTLVQLRLRQPVRRKRTRRTQQIRPQYRRATPLPLAKLPRPARRLRLRHHSRLRLRLRVRTLLLHHNHIRLQNLNTAALNQRDMLHCDEHLQTQIQKLPIRLRILLRLPLRIIRRRLRYPHRNRHQRILRWNRNLKRLVARRLPRGIRQRPPTRQPRRRRRRRKRIAVQYPRIVRNSDVFR